VEILTPGTRRVVQALLDKGAATANEVAGELQLTSAAIRHHLEWLVEQNYVVASDQPAFGPRVTKRRGRPSKFFTLTNAGRQAFDQKYDDLAQTAFRWAAEKYGESAIKEIAQKQMDFQKNRWTNSINGEDLRTRVNQLTNVLTKEGYAASVTDSQSPIVQLSFHRCPIEDVASVLRESQLLPMELISAQQLFPNQQFLEKINRSRSLKEQYDNRRFEPREYWSL